MLHSAFAIFAVNQVFALAETKPIIDSFLATANKSVFHFVEERDSTFKKRYEQRLTEYFKILAEDKPALGISFAFMQNLRLDPLKGFQGQLLIMTRFGNSLSESIKALKRINITRTT